MALAALSVGVGDQTTSYSASPKDPLNVQTPLRPMELAITVDDLPAHHELPPGMTRHEVVEKITAALAAAGSPAVYGFTNGEPLMWDPGTLEVLKRWSGSGHALGNHTFSHLDLSSTTAEVYILNILAMEAVLRHLTAGANPRLVFRYPYLSEGDSLDKRNTVRDFLLKSGYTIAQVTIDFSDWAWSSAYTRCAMKGERAQQAWLRRHIVDAARRQLRRSQYLATLITGHDIKHILLLHLSGMNAVILPELLTALKQDGVRLISLEAAMADPIYQLNPNLAVSEGLTFLDQLVEVQHRDHVHEEQRYTVGNLNNVCKG